MRKHIGEGFDGRLITGLFQVVGFALFLVGLILVLRAYGMLRKDSVYVRYHKAVGFPLLIVGIAMLVVSLVA